MADDAGSEIAKGIVRNLVPLNAGQDIAGPYQKSESAVMQLLQRLGLVQAPKYTPKLNEPLPQVDPATGQIIYPQGWRGPR